MASGSVAVEQSNELAVGIGKDIITKDEVLTYIKAQINLFKVYKSPAAYLCTKYLESLYTNLPEFEGNYFPAEVILAIEDNLLKVTNSNSLDHSNFTSEPYI